MNALEILHLSANPQGPFILAMGVIGLAALVGAIYLMGRP